MDSFWTDTVVYLLRKLDELSSFFFRLVRWGTRLLDNWTAERVLCVVLASLCVDGGGGISSELLYGNCFSSELSILRGYDLKGWIFIDDNLQSSTCTTF